MSRTIAVQNVSEKATKAPVDKGGQDPAGPAGFGGLVGAQEIRRVPAGWPGAREIRRVPAAPGGLAGGAAPGGSRTPLLALQLLLGRNSIGVVHVVHRMLTIVPYLIAGTGRT